MSPLEMPDKRDRNPHLRPDVFESSAQSFATSAVKSFPDSKRSALLWPLLVPRVRQTSAAWRRAFSPRTCAAAVSENARTKPPSAHPQAPLLPPPPDSSSSLPPNLARILHIRKECRSRWSPYH